MIEEKNYTTIQSLQTGLSILEQIGQQGRPLKFTEIQHLTNMTKSKVHKYLLTLHQAGFLYRDTITNTYTLGHKLIELGHMAEDHTSIVEIADMHMKKFTEETGLTALIAIPTLEGPIIKEIWSVVYGINIGAQNGMILPLNSSTGMIFFAFKEGLPITNWLTQSLNMQPQSMQQTLIEESQQIAKQLFVAKSEPLVEHISSCSVPIFNSQQQLIAAVTAVGYKTLIPTTIEHEVAHKMLNLASLLSENLK